MAESAVPASFSIMKDAEFTGERLIPSEADSHLQSEHYSRYRFAGRLVAGRSVLDLGSGVGYGSGFLLAAGASKVVGVDVAADAVDYSRREYGGPRSCFSMADGRHLPFADATFQVVTCFEVLEHVADPADLMREARRVLSDDGLLIVSTPNRLVYSERRRAEPNPFHLHEVDRSELVSLIDDHFARFELYGQTSAEGILIQREGVVEHGLVPLEALGIASFLGPEDREENQEPEYFLAVCHVQSKASDAEVGGFYLAPVNLFERLRQQVLVLTQDLDEKRQWAVSLDREVREREAQVVALQEDLEEKAAWAQGLQSRIEEQERLIEQQKIAIESLKMDPGAGS